MQGTPRKPRPRSKKHGREGRRKMLKLPVRRAARRRRPSRRTVRRTGRRAEPPADQSVGCRAVRRAPPNRYPEGLSGFSPARRPSRRTGRPTARRRRTYRRIFCLRAELGLMLWNIPFTYLFVLGTIYRPLGLRSRVRLR